MRTTTCAAGVVLAAGGVARAQPALASLGTLPGDTNSVAYAVSGDGLVAVGSSGVGGGIRAFRWTGGTGMVSLGSMPGGTVTIARGVNDDGSVIVGYGAVGLDRAFRWTSATGCVNLGTLPGGIHSRAYGVSGDGLVVCGWSASPSSRAFRWTGGTGMVSLPLLNGYQNSEAYAISSDALRIAGWHAVPGIQTGVRWNQGAPELLGELVPNGGSVGYGANADGSVIVGMANTAATNAPFRWQNGVMEELLTPGWTTSEARAVSGDGSLVVGTGGPGALTRAFMWTRALGLVDMNSHLPGIGVDLTGWTLSSADGVSRDGTVIVGNGRFNGRSVGWILTGLCAAPTIVSHPADTIVCPAGPALMSVGTTGSGLGYRWQREGSAGLWTDLADGVIGGLGTVAGSGTANLSITAMDVAAGGLYRCVMSNACAPNPPGVPSDPARLGVCAADFNCDGFLDFFDVGTFIQAFEIGDPSADFNQDGFLDFFDANEFTIAFETGC